MMEKIYGDFTIIDEPNEDLFCYWRRLDALLVLIILNFTEKDVNWKIPTTTGPELNLPNLDGATFELLVSNYDDAAASVRLGLGDEVKLSGYEGRVYLLG